MKVTDNKIRVGKASSLKIGAFLGGTPILGPQGPKKGDPPKSAPIDH